MGVGTAIIAPATTAPVFYAITATPTPVSTALVVRKEPAPKNPLPAVVAKKDTVDRKGKGKEVRPVFLLDEMVAMTQDRTGLRITPCAIGRS